MAHFLRVVMVSMSAWTVFKMAPSSLDKQTAPESSCNLPHHWLMSSLAMDLFALCDSYVELKVAPMDTIWLLSSVNIAFAHHLVAPHHPPQLEECL